MSMIFPHRTACGAVAVLAILASEPFSSRADEKPLPSAAQRQVDFVADIRPIFAEHCYGCHGPQMQESGFRLDRKQAALGVADRGERPIVPGKSAESPLVQFVERADKDTIMPPEGEGRPLSADQIALLRAWIDQGANWPDGIDEDLPDQKLTTDHWSFQPLSATPPPALSDHWIAGGIDAFILAKLREAGLEPSPAAGRVALIRRLHFDMHGLPPKPDDVRQFIDDASPDAYARLVECVLASPRYGERWAQHWLDVVRFAESHGFETNIERPNAWRYRDYVIRAFNDDKPYDQFIFEQIAGDTVGEDAATGFLVAGPWDQVKSPNTALTLMQRQDELADITNTTATALLGLTIACARCHNHKFDPILQKDYFSLQAIFAGVQHGERPLRPADGSPSTKGVREPVNPRTNEERFSPRIAKAVRFTVKATGGGEPCLDELEVWAAAESNGASRNVALADAGGKPSSSGNYRGDPKHELAHVNDGKYGNDWSWISDTPGRGWVRIDLAQPTVIDRIVWGRDRLGGYTDRLATDYSVEVLGKDDAWTEVASSEDRNATRQQKKVYAGTFAEPAPTHRLYRGDPMAPKEVVAPDVLTVLDTLGLSPDTPEQQRRIALANWIVAPQNPLTARVMVNRIWQHHFGTGLVDTPSDFGANGSRPTHPQLLDWLAKHFIDSGWSIKHMHRLILLSNTYQQSSQPHQRGRAADAGGRLLWRYPPRRLEAESIRDSILQITSVLDLEMGGPGWSAFKPNDNYVRVYEPKDVFGPAEWRRMIYMQKIRMRQDGVFGALDCPDGGQVCPKRTCSTTAIQALNLFNSGFMLRQAELLAERLRRETGPSPADQIRLAFVLAFNRQPEQAELQSAEQLAAAHGLTAFCRAVLNASELMFIP